MRSLTEAHGLGLRSHMADPGFEMSLALRLECVEESHMCILRIKHSSLATNESTQDTMSASGCGAEGNEDRVLTLHEFWELAKEID